MYHQGGRILFGILSDARPCAMRSMVRAPPPPTSTTSALAHRTSTSTLRRSIALDGANNGSFGVSARLFSRKHMSRLPSNCSANLSFFGRTNRSSVCSPIAHDPMMRWISKGRVVALTQPEDEEDVDDETHRRKMSRIATVPNILSVGRIVATPYVAHLVLNGSYVPAMWLFVAMGVSDYFDGYIAKNYDQKSHLGSALDPLADKVMVITMFSIGGITGLINASLVGLIVLRDITLITGAIFHRYRSLPRPVRPMDIFNPSKIASSGLDVQASTLSKVNTAGQVALLSISLATAAYGLGDSMPLVQPLLTCGVGITTLWSGYGYIQSNPFEKLQDAAPTDRQWFNLFNGVSFSTGALLLANTIYGSLWPIICQ